MISETLHMQRPCILFVQTNSPLVVPDEQEIEGNKDSLIMFFSVIACSLTMTDCDVIVSSEAKANIKQEVVKVKEISQ